EVAASRQLLKAQPGGTADDGSGAELDQLTQAGWRFPHDHRGTSRRGRRTDREAQLILVEGQGADQWGEPAPPVAGAPRFGIRSIGLAGGADDVERSDQAPDAGPGQLLRQLAQGRTAAAGPPQRGI